MCARVLTALISPSRRVGRLWLASSRFHSVRTKASAAAAGILPPLFSPRFISPSLARSIPSGVVDFPHFVSQSVSKCPPSFPLLLLISNALTFQLILPGIKKRNFGGVGGTVTFRAFQLPFPRMYVYDGALSVLCNPDDCLLQCIPRRDLTLPMHFATFQMSERRETLRLN